MHDYSTQQHSVWECKYHIVFVLKYRRKALYSAIRKDLGVIFRRLAEQKECVLEEGKIMRDHVHMMLSIPPKYSVSHVVGFIKGKSAIAIARQYRGRTKNFAGERFWARGYFVSTVGRDEMVIRDYIQNQEKEDRRLDQLQLFK
jgi:putative transposase